MSIRRSSASTSTQPSPVSPTSTFDFDQKQGHLHVPSLLPSPITHSARKHSLHPYRRILQVILWIGGVSVACFALARVFSEQVPRALSYSTHGRKAYQIIGSNTPPLHPSAILVTDERGRAKWTVSIPSSYDFPLRPKDYAEICTQSQEVAQHILGMKSHVVGAHRHVGHFAYRHIDTNYMDVSEAEEHGILEASCAKLEMRTVNTTAEDRVDMMSEAKVTQHGQAAPNVCKRSLTFALETADAGMGSTLMTLWMAYGLAKKEGRAFFIDDTRWPYGKYTTYFAAPPKPSCSPPPKTQIVPCPHHARHLFVSVATIPWTFGHAFNEAYEDPRKMEVKRQKNIFNLVRQGYEALFHLNDEDAAYVNKRIEELRAHVDGEKGVVVGMHIRHGDRHPREFQYQKSYIPLDRYVSVARDFLPQATPSNSSVERVPKVSSGQLIVASDDPDVYADPEMRTATRAQDRIMLASKATLDAVSGNKGNKKFVDENIGWEGGFYKDIFWNLGLPSTLSGTLKSRLSRFSSKKPASRDEVAVDHDSSIPEQALRLRELVGRAYLLDLAVLGRSDGVVCGVSAVGCRLLAVMMGWEMGIVNGGWRNVDGLWDWKGIVW
ncbi:MAG: hypothetical protein M1812_004859 [Candelaria pacifica]|nr:MAG: hypothetical protein M1812_004859 [Candelaria pacifica]